jgi:hypothetical protein
MSTDTVLNRIDDQAASLAQSALTGQITELEARAGLCALLMESRIPYVVSNSLGHFLSPQAIADVHESVQAKLVEQVLGQEGSTFDLGRIVESSFCGWARTYGTAVARWDDAVRPRGLDSLAIRISPLPPEFEPGGGHIGKAEDAYHSAQAFAGLSTEELALSGWSDRESQAQRESEALDVAVNATGFSRGAVRVGGSVLREVLGLPRVCIPAHAGDRAAVLSRVQGDPNLARRALVQMAAFVCAEPPHLPVPGEASVGELMLSLWDDYEPDHLESLMVRPAKAAHVIVVDALTPGAKPARAVIRALTRDVLALSKERDWSMAVDGLVASYLAMWTEPVSVFDEVSDGCARDEKIAKAAESAARWPDLAARAAAFRGAPLGSSVEQVNESVRSMFEAERDREFAARIAARTRRGLGLGVASEDDEVAAA